MGQQNLLIWTSHGLYCPAGDFFIDPLKKVNRAVITHAHSDHARSGSKAYLTLDSGAGVLRARISKKAPIETLAFGQTLNINGVRLSLHPAGHVLGSSQVRLEYKGEVWAVSGDYKLQPDPTCPPLEVVKCHTFVSESTFALPVYRWPGTEVIVTQINQWWQRNRERGIVSFLHGYSLGKSQRVLASIDSGIGPIYVHRAVSKINDAYIAAGVKLPETRIVTDEDDFDLRGALVIGPFSNPHDIANGAEFSLASASGWMRTKRTRKASALDRGFILSDHADWTDLLHVIQATGAERVVVVNGYVQTLSQWLQAAGISAGGLGTIRGGAYRPDLEDEIAFPAFGELELSESCAGQTMVELAARSPMDESAASATVLPPPLKVPLTSAEKIGFSDMYLHMDGSSRGRVGALSAYLSEAPGDDATAAVKLLLGKEAKQTIKLTALKDLAINESKLPDWIYRLCHEESGDIVETISLIVPRSPEAKSLPLSVLLQRVEEVRQSDTSVREKEIVRLWRETSCEDRIVVNRLLAGGFRVKEPSVIPAVSQVTGVCEESIAYQFKVSECVAQAYHHLRRGDDALADLMPLAFHPVSYVAGPQDILPLLEQKVALSAELRWEGIRAQIIRKRGQTLLWGESGQLLSDVFPEIVEAASALAEGTTIEGDILGWKHADVLPVSTIQKRLRYADNKKLRDEAPAVFMAQELLCERGTDIRGLPASYRRGALQQALTATAGRSDQQVEQLKLFSPCMLQLSPLLRTSTMWSIESDAQLLEKLQYAEQLGADGLAIKRVDSSYGEDHAPWFYLRPSPMIVNAALISIKLPRGEGDEPEFTMALSRNGELVPIAKLTTLSVSPAEEDRLTDFVRKNTVERFGPVRVLNPTLVFELACAGVQASNRHKAGLTVRHCKVLRWCRDSEQKTVHSVDALRGDNLSKPKLTYDLH